MKQAVISSYELPGGAHIMRMRQKNGTYKWAVKDGEHKSLSKKGFYAYEPMPSNRTPDFLEHCRFDSAEDAYAVWEKSNSLKLKGKK